MSEKESKGFFKSLKNKLSKTRTKVSDGIANAVLGRKDIDEDLLDEIETMLITSDMGMDATMTVINDLHSRLARKELDDADMLYAAMRQNMTEILDVGDMTLNIPNDVRPFVILMVGVNGVGKTTTIGKLTKRLQAEGKSVMLAAGDTFRAAAIDQLQQWGERNDVPVMAQKTGADSASVIFDAIQSAKAKNIDVVIADTSGRLHTQSNLMAELTKINRVIGKLDETAPHETLLVLDAGTGQNALNQAQEFNKAVGLTGLVVCKLDGTAKGGIVFAIAKALGIPIKFIGVGEGIEDLRPFDPQEFVDALLATNSVEKDSD